MTNEKRDIDIAASMKGLKTWIMRAVEDATRKDFRTLLEDARKPTGDGLILIAVAVEAELQPDADFETLWKAAGDWSLEDYSAVGAADGVDVDLEGDEALRDAEEKMLKTVPPSIATGGAAS